MKECWYVHGLNSFVYLINQINWDVYFLSYLINQMNVNVYIRDAKFLFGRRTSKPTLGCPRDMSDVNVATRSAFATPVVVHHRLHA